MNTWHIVAKEGYPTAFEPVMVTYGFAGNVDVYDRHRWNGSNWEMFWDDDWYGDSSCNDLVISWMPYPAPYKGDVSSESDCISSADVRNAVKSKWIPFPNNGVWDFKCDICHRIIPFGQTPDTMNFCPNCGADMR